MGPRHVLIGAGVAAVTLFFIGAGGAPRLTLRNDAISIDYPAHLGLALIVAAGLLAFGARRARPALRWTLAALAVACTGLGAARLAYSVAASGDDLRQRSLLGKTVLPWRTISKVDLEPSRIVAWGGRETKIRIGTSRLTADQRASLERTISRRVYEATVVPPAPETAESPPSDPARRTPRD